MPMSGFFPPFSLANLFPHPNVVGIQNTDCSHCNLQSEIRRSTSENNNGTVDETMMLQIVQSAQNIKVRVFCCFFFSLELSGDNAGSSSKKGGDGL